MIYKLWEKQSFRYCTKCAAIYIPRQLENHDECVAGPIDEVEKCDECCPLCPHCGKLFDRVKGVRRISYSGTLTKSGELTLDEDELEDNIIEICCAECGTRLPVEKYLKEIL